MPMFFKYQRPLQFSFSSKFIAMSTARNVSQMTNMITGIFYFSGNLLPKATDIGRTRGQGCAHRDRGQQNRHRCFQSSHLTRNCRKPRVYGLGQRLRGSLRQGQCEYCGNIQGNPQTI